MKIGFLGGTFDPIHLGHLQIAEEARKSLDLSEVILIPAGQPAIKTSPLITPAEERLDMVCLAVSDSPYLKVSAIETERSGPSYTVDTLAQLRNYYASDDEIYFILGWDSLRQLPDWRDPVRIVEMCHLVGVPRPGSQRPDLEVLEARIPGISQKVILLEKPLIDISASSIREMVARGTSIEHLVPGAVAEYIREHKLYAK